MSEDTPGTIVAHTEFERQADRNRRAGSLKANAHAECRRKFDLAVERVFADRFRCVLYEVEKDLNELVTICEDRWQGRVIALHKANVARKASLCDAFHVIEYGMNVDFFAFHRRARRKRLPCVRPA